MKIIDFYHQDTGTFSYIVIDETTNHCAILDSVMDYDPVPGRATTESADKIIEFVRQHQLKVEWILETHAHADHLTAAKYLKEKLGGKFGIGAHITDVLNHWVPIYNTFKDTPQDGSQFEHLFKEGDTFHIGKLEVRVLHTPGHTPACLSYLIEDCAFVGDTLLMPHIGTARVDFPGGSASTLYDSIQKLMSLPDETKIYICHDYESDGHKPANMATVKEHKDTNKMIHQGVSKDEYAKMRNTKDAGMSLPRLLLPSIQVNLRAGSLGDAEDNDIQYIKIPINQF